LPDLPANAGGANSGARGPNSGAHGPRARRGPAHTVLHRQEGQHGIVRPRGKMVAEILPAVTHIDTGGSMRANKETAPIWSCE